MFNLIKDYYAKGLYSKADMDTLKLGGLLTADQYDQLVGTDTVTTDAVK